MSMHALLLSNPWVKAIFNLIMLTLEARETWVTIYLRGARHTKGRGEHLS